MKGYPVSVYSELGHFPFPTRLHAVISSAPAVVGEVMAALSAAQFCLRVTGLDVGMQLMAHGMGVVIGGGASQRQ